MAGRLPRLVTLGRPTGRLAPGQLHRQVAAGRQLVEVVAGHVGMEGEVLGDLGTGATSRPFPQVEVDLPAGRVTESIGQGGDRGAELVGAERRVRLLAEIDGFGLAERGSTHDRYSTGSVVKIRWEECSCPPRRPSWRLSSRWKTRN
jgi:hypothetical protein